MRYYLIILLLPVICVSLATSCARQSGGGEDILDLFASKTTNIEPVDSLNLEDCGILFPVDAFRYKSWYVVHKFNEENAIDIIDSNNPNNIIRCFTIGRGPVELLSLTSVQLRDGKLYVYDTNKYSEYALDLDSTISQNRGIIRETISFSEKRQMEKKVDPVNICRSDSYFISVGFYNPAKWYVLLSESGDYLSGIDFFIPEQYSDFDENALGAIHCSSVCSISPDGNKAVVGMVRQCVISFSEIKAGQLKEYKRLVFGHFDVKATKEVGASLVGYGKKTVDAFYYIQSDDNYVYLLYSGKGREASTPKYECNNLLIMDWNGRPVKRLILSKSINSFSIDGNILYCSSSYPESRLYVYDIL